MAKKSKKYPGIYSVKGKRGGGKENPHRHGAHSYKPMGVPFGEWY